MQDGKRSTLGSVRIFGAFLKLAALFAGTFGVGKALAAIERSGTRGAARRPAVLRYQVSMRNNIDTGWNSNLGKDRGAWLLCSRLLFPLWFGERVRRLKADPATPSLLFRHAERYFGKKLSIEVSPSKLRTQLHAQVFDGKRFTRLDWRFLDAAVWSGAIRPFATNPTCIEMVELTKYGAAFRDMPAYEALLSSMKKGRPVYRNGVMLNSPQMLDGYFSHYLELIRHMRTEGRVRRHEDAPRIGATGSYKIMRDFEAEANERNPGVAINADGTLVRFMSGRHRTAIAQALQIPLMPVEVRLVHVGWLTGVMAEKRLPAHKAFLAGLAMLEEGPSARGA